MREQALSALFDRLQLIAGGTVKRNEALPSSVLAGGLVILARRTAALSGLSCRDIQVAPTWASVAAWRDPELDDVVEREQGRRQTLQVSLVKRPDDHPVFEKRSTFLQTVTHMRKCEAVLCNEPAHVSCGRDSVPGEAKVTG